MQRRHREGLGYLKLAILSKEMGVDNKAMRLAAISRLDMTDEEVDALYDEDMRDDQRRNFG